MHESGIVEDVLRIIRTKIEGLGRPVKVAKINLKIGALKAISPDHFRFHFDELVKNTELENVPVEIKEVPGWKVEVESIEVE